MCVCVWGGGARCTPFGGSAYATQVMTQMAEPRRLEIDENVVSIPPSLQIRV